MRLWQKGRKMVKHTQSEQVQLGRLKQAMRNIRAVVKDDILPSDPKELLMIGMMAPKLADFLEVVVTQASVVEDILEE